MVLLYSLSLLPPSPYVLLDLALGILALSSLGRDCLTSTKEYYLVRLVKSSCNQHKGRAEVEGRNVTPDFSVPALMSVV